ncbi:T-cell surface glycoprotein CD3 zeta chain [Ailuropoda melanoleuca]|uniref:T-cell surface glycoprotein CD3 zeta chain n=1 Tax=Ailuropoda melanoleuca TaxID=9646 RepID=UPI001494719C|nr:T-cell surface glycoprotein CD3 zeta chain [Ailuropoda melanoleuca]
MGAADGHQGALWPWEKHPAGRPRSSHAGMETGARAADLAAADERSRQYSLKPTASHSASVTGPPRDGGDTFCRPGPDWSVSSLGTGAQSFGLLDPKLCYLLDGLLFIYGLVITALFLRAKFGRSAAVPEDQQGPNQLYNELNLRGREEYEVLDKRRGLDPEMGGKQQRKRNPQEVVYNALQKDKMAEAYSEIGIKGENQRRRGKGHDGLYQGLSTATKDTYDALHMQTLPPR